MIDLNMSIELRFENVKRIVILSIGHCHCFIFIHFNEPPLAHVNA